MPRLCAVIRFIFAETQNLAGAGVRIFQKFNTLYVGLTLLPGKLESLMLLRPNDMRKFGQSIVNFNSLANSYAFRLCHMS